MKNNFMCREYFVKWWLNQNTTSKRNLPRCDPVDIQALEIHLGGVKFAKKNFRNKLNCDATSLILQHK
mgnify:FL=1